MDIAGKVVVVTGGGGGIGEALCRALAAAGAQAIVVADIDEAQARRVAGSIDEALGEDATHPVVHAQQVDAGDEASVKSLVGYTTQRFGPIDLFCANAGIMVIGGVEASDDDWQRIWGVNVMGHVYAARAVLPQMVERGEGYFMTTASAAGLLTQLGSAPYSVTKHAAVGLAEWLSITYGDSGVKFSCLCPQAVRTAMIGAAGDEGAAEASQAATDGILAPSAVADAVVAGLAKEEFLILPHPEVATYEQRRAGDRERWLRGMRRMQAAMVALYTGKS